MFSCVLEYFACRGKCLRVFLRALSRMESSIDTVFGGYFIVVIGDIKARAVTRV